MGFNIPAKFCDPQFIILYSIVKCCRKIDELGVTKFGRDYAGIILFRIQNWNKTKIQRAAKRVDPFSKGFYSHTNFYLLISFPLIGEISYCILATLRTNGTDPLYWVIIHCNKNSVIHFHLIITFIALVFLIFQCI